MSPSSHDRRRIVHLSVTAHPTSAWTAQQLREAWPWSRAPRCVIRDRDTIYGWDFRRTADAMGIDEVLTAPRAPWQNPFVERVIGSIRRECLDHGIVSNERSLPRHLQQSVAYSHRWRTHLSLDKDRRGTLSYDETAKVIATVSGLLPKLMPEVDGAFRPISIEVNAWTKRAFIKATVNGVEGRFLLDTGTSDTIRRDSSRSTSRDSTSSCAAGRP